MKWNAYLTSSTLKQKNKLPTEVQEKFIFLLKEIEASGPVRGNWPNYSKLGKNRHHCHIKNGRPSYIACWEVVNTEIKIIGVYYVGTREKAPY